MFEKSNLTPRERIMTIIRNGAHRNITGKQILSDADIKSLSDDWNAKTNQDVNEYNKYWHLWDTFKYFEIDMQNLVNSIQIDYSNFERVLLLYYYREKPDVFDKVIKKTVSKRIQKWFSSYFG